jgi:HAD superfamily hydrolase (TIGR01549 family)
VSALALFDLDNTLLDRASAFARWAKRFIEENELPSRSWSVIEHADVDGTRSRRLFFDELRAQFGITTGSEDLIARYYVDYSACFTIESETVEALRLLRSRGWKVAVVTNGPRAQWRKLEVTNLADEVDSVCISEVVGAQKPDTAIFREAARTCGLALDGWMVGDSASADIAGGQRAGLRTIWMARGREWNLTQDSPDAIVSTIPEAVDVILHSVHGPVLSA